MSDNSESNTPSTEEEAPQKRGRGRPRVAKPPVDDEPKPKRPRGRPKGSFKVEKEEEPKPKRKRGRPRKASTSMPSVHQEVSLISARSHRESEMKLKRAREKLKDIKRHIQELESILF